MPKMEMSIIGRKWEDEKITDVGPRKAFRRVNLPTEHTPSPNEQLIRLNCGLKHQF